jgi:hypothetical protein
MDLWLLNENEWPGFKNNNNGQDLKKKKKITGQFLKS